MYDPEMRKDCPMRGNLGNCSPVGGFCMDAVSDEICEAVHNAYEDGYGNAMITMQKSKAIKPICKIIFDVPYYFCGDCKAMLNMYSTKAKFCSRCGQVVQWGNMTVKESKENVRDKTEESIKKSVEYLDWYFAYDDGTADKDAQKAWFELRGRINLFALDGKGNEAE